VKVAIGTDTSTHVTEALAHALRAADHDVLEIARDDPWPDVGRRVGEAVAAGEAERGIVCCWTGTGVSIAANKVPGVRAALCTDVETARGARRWNDANVLALGLRLTSEQMATEIALAFMESDVDPDERAVIDRVEP
jgi:ribose 5-phosphate isomerase B